ncbi:hypothetical protein ABZ847_29505 [Streptomyces bauhiniae]
MRRWLARLVDAEVRRLTAERDHARTTRAQALRAALRWQGMAQRRTVGRCGHRLYMGLGGQTLPCALPAGHGGWHRDDAGAEWTPGDVHGEYEIKESTRWQ